jgi:hypothetical protein
MIDDGASNILFSFENCVNFGKESF